MSTIGIKCVDQVMTFTNMPVITAGDQNVDKVQFDFCPLWDGFVKVAVFFQQKTECSYALINADGSCNIPNSILQLEGKIFIAVTGTNTSNQVRTSNILSYHVDEGIVDASLQDEFPSDITEEEKNDVYNKMLEMSTELQNLCQDLITNFAYVRVEGANTFEYDESALEAKIRAYTYPKDNIYSKAETYSKPEIDSKFNDVYTKGEIYSKNDFLLGKVTLDMEYPYSSSGLTTANFDLPSGFNATNCLLIGCKVGIGNTLEDAISNPTYVNMKLNRYVPNADGTIITGVDVICRPSGNTIEVYTSGKFRHVELLFMKI